MPNRTVATCAFASIVLACSLALAQGAPPPPGWGKPAPLPPANGQGQVSFKQAGTPFTLPLQKIEITNPSPDMIMVSLEYVDAAQANKLTLAFMSMPKLGKSDPLMVSGFLVQTKAHGLSRHAANKGKCTLALASLTPQAVSGTLACTAMTDMAATGTAPDVTEVKFEGRLNAK